MPNQGPRAATSAPGERARRTAIASSRIGFVVLASMAMASCDGGGDARFGVQYASDFAPARHMVSVLGVYENGRMSPGAWDTFAPHLMPAVGSATCDAGYDSLMPVDGALASAIDEFARADGPTDDLLTQLAPAAKGDSILVITMSGQLPTKAKASGGTTAKPQTSAGGGRRAGHPMRGPSRAAPGGPEANVLEISALLYSVAKAQSVGALTMQYSGASIDDAEAKFSLRLAQAFPSMGCVDWNWSAKVDADRIRASIDQ
jgi:hypothetical protein